MDATLRKHQWNFSVYIRHANVAIRSSSSKEIATLAYRMLISNATPRAFSVVSAQCNVDRLALAEEHLRNTTPQPRFRCAAGWSTLLAIEFGVSDALEVGRAPVAMEYL